MVELATAPLHRRVSRSWTAGRAFTSYVATAPSSSCLDGEHSSVEARRPRHAHRLELAGTSFGAVRRSRTGFFAVCLYGLGLGALADDARPKERALFRGDDAAVPFPI